MKRTCRCIRNTLKRWPESGATARQVSRWLNAASFHATAAQITAISQLPFVDKIDLVGGGKGTDPNLCPPPQPRPPASSRGPRPTRTWMSTCTEPAILACSRSMCRLLTMLDCPCNGVTIAILDTGFELAHECFENLDVVDTWDFVNGNYFVAEMSLTKTPTRPFTAPPPCPPWPRLQPEQPDRQPPSPLR